MNVPTPWQPVVRPPVDGESVNAAVTGRGMRDNAQRTAHLKDVIDAFEGGRAVLRHDQILDVSTKPFQPVYLASDGVWKPAQLEFQDGDDGVLAVLGPRSYVLGVISHKLTPTSGTVVLSGEITTTDSTALFSVMDEPFTAGLYYLSSSMPGHITSRRPAAPVRVLTLAGPFNGNTYRAFVNLVPKSELDEHMHYHVKLVTAPAGTPNCVPPYLGPTLGESEPLGPYPGVTHSIVTENQTSAGWLPVASSVFVGMSAPAGAKFGYNIQADPHLASLWPPVPAGFAVVEVNGENFTDDHVIVDENGIWWMDDSYGMAPWSPNFPCADEETESSSGIAMVTFPLRIDFWMTRLFFGNIPLVTALVAEDKSLVFENALHQTASTGRVFGRVVTPTVVSSLDTTVVKRLDLANGQVFAGPIVAGVRPLSPNLVIVGGTLGTDGYYRGNLGLEFNDLSYIMDLPLEITALNNVEEEDLNGTLVLTYPAGRPAQIRGKLLVHDFNIGTGLTLSLRLKFWLLARAGLTLNQQPWSCTCARVPAPAACVPQTLPVADTPVNLTLCTSALVDGQYVEVSSDLITIAPGDVVYFTLARDTDQGAVSLLRVRPMIEVS